MTSLRNYVRPGATLSFTLFVGILVAACTSGSGGEGSGDVGGGATVAVTDGAVEIGADDLEFDAATITATAGEPFTVVFTNNEAQPHNFAVYVSEGGDEIAIGDVINEGETNEVEIEALEAGTYYFRCDVHPDMEGTIVVEG